MTTKVNLVKNIFSYNKLLNIKTIIINRQSIRLLNAFQFSNFFFQKNEINTVNSNLFEKFEKPQLNHIRYKSKNHSKKDKNRSKSTEEKDNDGENDDSDDEENIEEIIDSIDTSSFKPAGFKIMVKHVNSLRLDSLLSAGLNISRNKIENYFYSSKLKLNGDKVAKKSHSAKESDKIDLLGDVDERIGKRTIKRVLLYKILNEETKTNKIKVILVVWKSGLYEEDSYKSF